MKVLLVTHFFPPGHPGGTENYTLGVAKMLDRLGHSPYVLCAEGWGSGNSWSPWYEDTLHEDIPVRRLHWNWQLAPDPFVGLYDNPESTRLFVEYVREIRPDVVHVTSCYALGARILQASRQEGLPTFLTLTDFWFLCPRHTLYRTEGGLCEGPASARDCLRCMAAKSLAYRAMTRVLPNGLAVGVLESLTQRPRVARLRGLRGYVGDSERRLAFLRAAFRNVDVAIAPSKFLMQMFSRNGYGSKRMIHSPYGLDTSWMTQLCARDPGATPCIGYVGQIDPIKGLDVLVKAFQLIPAQLPAELRIYGDLSKNPQFTDALLQISAGNPRIKFMGPFERAELGRVLSLIDVVAVPSVWFENTPLVIAEAFAAGKPVIATNLGGMSEMVEHGVDGLLFERGDVHGLSRAIQLIVSDPSLLAQLCQGIKPVRTIQDEIEALLQMYGSAVHRATA